MPEDEDIDARLAREAAKPTKGAKAPEEDRKHPVLSNAEYDAAVAEAKKRLDDAERKAARERLIADSMDAIRRERNALTGQIDLDEPVMITVDVAEYTDRIIIDGKQYFHGSTYTVPRHTAQTLNEVMFRSYMHQAQLDGKDPQEAYRRSHAQHVTKQGVAPVTPSLSAKIGSLAA